MPPQIVGYDPFSKVRQIEETGDTIANILGEARKAEMALQKQRIAQKGATYLHDVINQRIQETGNPEIGFAPFIDPVVNRAASMVEPVSRDYVELMKGIHDKNVKMLEPKNVPGGYIKYQALTDEQGKPIVDERGLPKFDYKFTHTEPDDIQVIDHVENVDGKPVIRRDYVNKSQQKTVHSEDVGGAMTAASGGGGASREKNVAALRGKLAEINATKERFEKNEKLSANYEKILKDTEYQEALQTGDLDMVTAIIARLTGDNTPERVTAKLFFEYADAVAKEANIREQLNTLKVDVADIDKKKPTGKAKKRGGF